MPKNRDYEYPKAETYFFAPVNEGNFFNPELQLPIYWGPDQKNNGFYTYTPPNPDAWRHYEYLNIPQVIRFLVGAPETYDDHDFDDTPVEFPWTCVYLGDQQGRCVKDDTGETICVENILESGVYFAKEGEYPFPRIEDAKCGIH